MTENLLPFIVRTLLFLNSIEDVRPSDALARREERRIMSINKIDENIHTGLYLGGDRSIRPDGKCWSSIRRFLLILLLIILLPVSSVAQNLTCSRLPALMKGWLANHYAIKSVTAEIRNNAVDQMIKRIDPAKTLLHESDVVKLKPVLQSLYANLQKSNCVELQQVYSILVARVRENEAIVKKILGPDFKLDESVELNTNVDKRSFVKTVSEKQELLRKVVQFQIENSLLAGIDLTEAKKQQIHHYELQTMRIVQQNPEKLVTKVAEAFALALDPHTTYLSPENYEDFRIQTQLFLEGIGASLSSVNGFTVIEELIPGGGAERSGRLKVKDKIIAVAQEGEKPVGVIDMDLRDVIKMIRGKKGTKVTLTILRQAEHTYRFDVTIVRDKIDIKEQEAKIHYETRTVDGRKYQFAVIDLPSFYGDQKANKSCYEDVKRLLAEAKSKHVDGIVLDLSRNGGGLLTEAVRLAGLFIGDGGIVATKDNRDRVNILANGSKFPVQDEDNSYVISFPAEDPRSLYKGPLVVLTSRMSASASEIVAGALKDYQRAVIVGSDHTFGKGSVQVMTSLPWNLGGMTVTTAMYFLPGGKSTQKIGVDADIKLPGWFVLEDIGEAALDYALPAEMITPFLDLRENAAPFWNLIDKPLIADLKEKSKIRVAKDEKFAEIIRKNKDAAMKKGMIRLSDLRKEMAQENGGKKNETPAEVKQKVRDQFAPYLNESINVLLDLVMSVPVTAH